MKLLVLGSGAREHALAATLARDPAKPEVLVAPGNDGIAADHRCVPVDLGDLDAVVALARREAVTLTVAGNEEPLARGIWDAFDAAGLRLLGPSALAARLESSKAWAKEFMARHDIPTPPFEVFDDVDAAVRHVQSRPMPCVVKADGLAAGKGVYVVDERADAETCVRALLAEGRHGAAGRRVLVEDCITGRELSVFVLSDGYSHRFLGAAQDHKRAYDGDRGPNTGGMGAYSPVPFVDDDLRRQIDARILGPTLAGMLDEGLPYRGFLFLGLMCTPEGPQVLEYNCRLGDPEAQVVLPRLRTEFAELLLAADAGEVTAVPVAHEPEAAVGVVVASAGYPGTPQAGRPIRGLEAARTPGVELFFAGVRRRGEQLETAGGRILTVVGRGKDLAAARERAYGVVSRLDIPGAFYRSDIASQALELQAWQSPASES